MKQSNVSPEGHLRSLNPLQKALISRIPNSSQTSPSPPDIPETRITKVRHRLRPFHKTQILTVISKTSTANQKSLQFVTVTLMLSTKLKQLTKLCQKNTITLTTPKTLKAGHIEAVYVPVPSVLRPT